MVSVPSVSSSASGPLVRVIVAGPCAVTAGSKVMVLVESVLALADVIANDKAWRLATAFWPGPLTLVLARRPDCAISLFASGGLDTLAVRVPEHCVARALLLEAGVPVAAPSANRSGRVSPTTAQHVLQELSGRIAASGGVFARCWPHSSAAYPRT